MKKKEEEVISGGITDKEGLLSERDYFLEGHHNVRD